MVEGTCTVEVQKIVAEIYEFDFVFNACIEHAVDALTNVGSWQPVQRLTKIDLAKILHPGHHFICKVVGRGQAPGIGMVF